MYAYIVELSLCLTLFNFETLPSHSRPPRDIWVTVSRDFSNPLPIPSAIFSCPLIPYRRFAFIFVFVFATLLLCFTVVFFFNIFSISTPRCFNIEIHRHTELENFPNPFIASFVLLATNRNLLDRPKKSSGFLRTNILNTFDIIVIDIEQIRTPTVSTRQSKGMT